MRDRPVAIDQRARLPRRFYQRDATTLARALLGQRLVRLVQGQVLAGIIVETEAYLGAKDKAAHTYNGRRTARNESMYGNGGTAYVYFTYGMHYCLNVVARRRNEPEAVLIRAVEPTHGIERMFVNRRAAKRKHDLCSGPAKLCQAMEIDRALDGADLTSSEAIFIERLRQRAMAKTGITVGPRVGVGYAQEWAHKPLRFYIAGHGYQSRR